MRFTAAVMAQLNRINAQTRTYATGPFLSFLPSFLPFFLKKRKHFCVHGLAPARTWLRGVNYCFYKLKKFARMWVAHTKRKHRVEMEVISFGSRVDKKVHVDALRGRWRSR